MMSATAVKLQSISVSLDDLLLDPNNPRCAWTLAVQQPVPDSETPTPERQKSVGALFLSRSSMTASNDESGENEEGQILIRDLVVSMTTIGFVPIDRIVVRVLEARSRRKPKYVVVEGNRRIAAAKYLQDWDRCKTLFKDKESHTACVKTLEQLDVLLLDTKGLSEADLHDQIGVILGLRHFGSVLQWGPLAKAVNIFQEYMRCEPSLKDFVLQPVRVGEIAARLSQSRSAVTGALKAYIAFVQLQGAFPQGPPKPTHYSLIEACIQNGKLATAGFIEQNQTSFELAAAALEKLNTVCEFASRADQKDTEKILRDPKSVKDFATLVSHAASDEKTAVPAFAASLRDAVIRKERSLDDAVAHLKSFIKKRNWTTALEALLKKVVEPGGAPGSTSQTRRLELTELGATGNDPMKLAEARAAFKNVRLILGV